MTKQAQRSTGIRRPSHIIIVLWLTLLASGSAQEQSFNWSESVSLYPGIQLTRLERKDPRTLVIHAARVDTQAGDLSFHTTGRRQEWTEGKEETDRKKTRDFLLESRQAGTPIVLAINADAFSPWPAPYNQSTPADVMGLAISDGELVSRGSGTPSILQSKDGKWRIETTPRSFEASEIKLAISGFGICLQQGKPLPSGKDLHPRTSIGLSQDARYIVIVLVDGRQPASWGVTTEELGGWLKYFGAYEGINLDGGGSTTMAIWDSKSDPQKCRLVNRPVGNGVRAENVSPLLFLSTERANGNNLGVAFKPKAP
jgi:hypothetical protein